MSGCVGAMVALAVAALAAPGIEIDPPALVLRGSDSRAQLVVTGPGAADLTHAGSIRYESRDPGVVVVDRDGVVTPTGPGATEIRVADVEGRGGTSAATTVVVEDFDDRRPVGFVAEVVPILTRFGCNAGACHGKSGGQNGFRLSLLGSDPALDRESLARDGRGRRVFPAAPDLSLILRKPSARLPHGGGKRFEPDSAEYRTLRRWIARGMVFDPGAEPALSGLEVRPIRRVVPSGGTRQLRVVARYADGTETDVTRLARYQSNAVDLAEVDDRGLVSTRLGVGVGGAAILARFGGGVALASVIVPLAQPTPEWTPPPPRNLVDRHVFARLKALGLPPSPACDDATFARRAALDIVGLLPRPDEVAALEADGDPEKRVRYVDRLLERPEYADRFAMTWSAVLRNKRTLGKLSEPGTFAFHAWVRQSLAENRPYDQFVAAILTARGDPAVNPPVVWYRQASTVEERSDDAAQLFLGLRLQCARCHHHPFERWGQEDYHGFASLFARVGRKPGADLVTPRVFVTATGQAIDAEGRSWPPRLLDASSPLELGPESDPRAALMDWLRRPDNPWFARAVVNRYWKHFFGRGLVEPEDDLRASNPAVDPDLLDALAEDFQAHGYDLKRLVRTLATSRAYERSSAPNPWNALDRQAFSRFYPRRLPAEVLLDAIDTAAGVSESFAGLPPGLRAAELPDEGFDTPCRFLDVFGRPKRESVCECERSPDASLTQSLHLLNSAEIERKVSAPDGRAARWAADGRTDAAKVVELYRIALARLPTDAERDVCLAHLRRRRAEGAARRGWEDLIWTAINTKEFAFVE